MAKAIKGMNNLFFFEKNSPNETKKKLEIVVLGLVPIKYKHMLLLFVVSHFSLFLEAIYRC